MNKKFVVNNLPLFFFAILFGVITLVIRFKYNNYSFSIPAAVIFIAGYTSMLLIEKNIIKAIRNNTIKVLLKIHIIFSAVMLVFYLIIILYINLK